METMPGKNARNGNHLWIALISLALCGFVLLGYVLWSAYQEVWAEARSMASSQSELLEARFDSTLRRIDMTLNELAEHVPKESLHAEAAARFRPDIEKKLARLQRAFPEIAGFRVVAPDGNVLYLSGGGEYVNLLDRSYFKVARSGTDGAIVFSEVVKSRITGRDTIAAARAIRAPDGRFIGMVSAAIEIDHFEQLFNAAHLGASGAVAIRHSDTHALVLRQPPVPAEINRPLNPSHPLYQSITAGKHHGVLEFAAQSDGVKRVYGYRVLEHYPFYVLAGLSESDVMASWRQRTFIVGVFGAALLACLLIVLYELFRARRRELAAAINLRRNGERLSVAQRIAQLGSWEIDLATMQVTCSDELYRIFEIPRVEGAAPYDELLVQIHPEDRAIVDRTLKESVAQGGPDSLKHRLEMPDGRIKYVLECWETEYGKDGEPLRLIGTSQDVSVQHETEAQMQLLASAVQHSGEAILITDVHNNIITVNPAFTRLTGYSAEEAAGRNPRFLSAGRTTPEEYARMWEGITEKGFWQGEIWDRRKDGGIYPKWISISVIRDEEGKILYHIAHFTDVSTERATEERLHHIAHHDVLTGLLNRLSLKGRMDQALATARRDGSRVAVMFIDLDRFKVINDTLGHHMGDELLIEVARRLRESVRDSDVVARLGGDEFVIMLSGVDHTSSIALIAEKLVLSVGHSYQIGGYDLYTSPSIGIAIFPTDGLDGETLMKNADAAMYHAKAAGRNNFQFFDAKMNDVALDRLKTEHSLRHALSRDEFRLHFQPIIDMASGKVAAVEALVRWQHPERGLLAPGSFIGIAEETGLIQPLGEWVLWAACRQLAEFYAAGLSGVKMGINISAIQMRNGNLPVLARGIIQAYDLNPADLIFEITESVAMEQPLETVRILDILHSMGIVVAIDDFGTGYSSLGYLRMFPLKHLKLDRSFVEEIGEDTDGSVICDATIGLAHNLGLKVVAEGVETVEQLDYLRSRGCDLVQGYLYSRPVPAAEVMAFIQQHNS
ncbi:MAG: EAL domain-containing protein [Azonexus sp.]|nr:EAL domain-containing protein [Azonexus sp.]